MYQEGGVRDKHLRTYSSGRVKRVEMSCYISARNLTKFHIRLLRPDLMNK